MSELAELRKDLKRYTGLHLWLGDEEMCEHLRRLIKETQAKIAKLEATEMLEAG